MKNNPYSMNYTQGELLPNFRRIPPPEVLQVQARQNWNDFKNQAWQLGNEYAYPLVDNAVRQFVQYAASTGATGKPLSHWIMKGAGSALNTPQALATIAAIQGTRAGAPIVNGIRNFAASPTGQKIKTGAENLINWIF